MLTFIIPLLISLLLLLCFNTSFLWISYIIYLIIISLVSILILTPIYRTFILNTTIFDPLSVMLVTLSFWISALIILARKKILFSSINPKKFLFFVIILLLFLILAFRSANFLYFYINFEASLIPTLLLILTWGYQPERLQAGIYLILYTITASLPLLLRLLIINSNSSHLSIIIPFWSLSTSSSLNSFWWLISIAAFLVKTPLFLTHLWLPKAHVEAPVAGSIILAGLLLKLGTYGLLRLATPFLKWNRNISPCIIRISLRGALITSLICIRQTDIKSLIAYSSVSHIGLATAGIISNTNWGWNAALLIILAHGLASSSIFSLANIIYETINSRSLFVIKGLILIFPAITLWWFLITACNIAAPPSINLLAEIILITATLSYAFSSVLLLALVSFFVAAYSLFLYTSIHHGNITSFFNPVTLFSPLNYTLTALHFIPILLLILNPAISTLWIWLYSWITTLNCKFKSVYILKLHCTNLIRIINLQLISKILLYSLQ